MRPPGDAGVPPSAAVPAAPAVGCLLDGTALAARLEPRLRAGAERFAARHGRPPALVAVLDGAYAPSRRQAALKAAAGDRAGIRVRVEALPPDADTATAVAVLTRLADDPSVDGILLQYPLPAGVDGDAAAAALVPGKDLDVSGPVACRCFEVGGPAPAAAAAMISLLRHHRIPVAGQRAVVVGRGTPHDHPFAVVLARSGAHVVTVDPADPALAAHLSATTLVVAAVGEPGSVPGAAVRPGTVLVDAGYFNAGARGDVALAGVPALEALAPVPGGIGPMTVALLLQRTLRAAWRTRGDVA